MNTASGDSARAGGKRRRVDASTLRIIKTIPRGKSGAKRHTHLYGDTLVCVRHRYDPTTHMRHVTVELVVEAWPIITRPGTIVAVRLKKSHQEQRRQLIDHGAEWDPAQLVWRMTYRTAEAFGMLNHIVPKAK